MHDVFVSKLFRGHLVSVRCSDVLKGSYKGGLVIIHNKQKMTVTKEICLSKYKERSNYTKVKSRYGTAPYYLIDFRWNPEKEDSQLNLLP